MTIMPFANTLGQNLSCSEIFNRRQILDRAAVIDATEVAAPDLVSLRDRGMLLQKIVIAVMRCSAGTVMLDQSPGRT